MRLLPNYVWKSEKFYISRLVGRLVGNALKKGLLSAILILVITISIAIPVQAIKVSASLPFRSGAIACDPGNGELLVTTSKSYVNELGMQNYNLTNIISAISYKTNTVVANVTVENSPINLVYDSGKGETFVANHGSGTVSVIMDSIHSVIATINLKSDPSYLGPYALVYDSGKGEIFVSDPYSGIISVISDSTNKVVSTVPLGNYSGPEGLIYDSVKNEIFVICANPESNPNGPNYIKIISDGNNSVIATIPLENYPSSFGAYDRAKGEILVANPFNNTISAISDSTYALVAIIPVGNTPTSVAYGENEILVTNGDDDTVSVISDSTNTLLATIPVGEKPLSIVYDDGINEAFVRNSDSISVLSDFAVPVSPTPTVPEFSNIYLVLIIATVSAFLSAVYRNRRKSS
jgi:YVTN family beta-propeller protein